MSSNRLFLFAGYTPDGIIDDALVFYIQSLHNFGDIIFVMDSDCPESELKKISPYTIYKSAIRHNEYDFGSYKRGFIWATENIDISQYDFIYMINDSMYGPLFNLAPYFIKMENLQTDAFGMVKNPRKKSPHIQSWFIGMRSSVFLTDWFKSYIHSICHQPTKELITALYEDGFTQNLINHNLSWDCLYSAKGRCIYNMPKRLFRKKMPFIKKVCFTRHYGALGRQNAYILNHIDTKLQETILTSARRIYGPSYIDKMLTRNPIKIISRNIKYTIHKLRTTGI